MTETSVLPRVLRAAFAALAVAAIVDTLSVSLDSPTFSPVNFFSYFTIEANLAGIVVLGIGALALPVGRSFDAVRGAVTLYLVMTGIIYAALLSNVGVGLAAPWTNTVLHRVMPAVVLVDWLLLPPRRRISYRVGLSWLAFPLVYFAYSLIRGPSAHWYPYPFLDPDHHGGYGRVALYAVVLAVGIAVLALAVVWAGEALRKRRWPDAVSGPVTDRAAVTENGP